MKEKCEHKTRILYLEAFYGGSHKHFADLYIQHSRFEIDLLTLPDISWKQRMRGAAFELALQVENPEVYAAVICGGMMRIQDLRSIWGKRCPPVILYVHETHLSYPVHPIESQTTKLFEFYQSELGNMLSSDVLLFNSRKHADRFLCAADQFYSRISKIGSFPDLIREKIHVVYPGCCTSGDIARRTKNRKPGPLRILWNHRWEFDKRPEDFFSLLEDLQKRNRSFELILLGENPWPNADIASGRHNQYLISICEQFRDSILHQGYIHSRKEYISWLEHADLVISTSAQENFGISVAEAMFYGCRPLLPDRLSYPEIVPETLHRVCLYKDLHDAADKLDALCLLAEQGHEIMEAGDRDLLATAMQGFSWEQLSSELDRHVRSICDLI